MKKLLVLILFSLVLTTMLVPAYAAKGRKGASDKAYENASENAIFNRVGDWFATVGKTEEEREAIISERREIRAQKRAQREAHRKEREAKREQNRSQKRAEGKIQDIEEQ